ncbi:MAG TPA: hypothetical protein EYN66_24840, partial [Myxococcales bacterium]|nr:hypothetical protein [Myxococcales bacterium]
MLSWSLILLTVISVMPPQLNDYTQNSGPGAFKQSPGSSCLTILEQGFSRGDGVYWVDPNGKDSQDSIQVYCDMTRNGGGWTLLLKMTGDTTFRYSSPLWTNDRLLLSHDISTAPENAKYPSYLKVPVHEIRACFPTQQRHCITANLPGKARPARGWLSGFPLKLGTGHPGPRLAPVPPPRRACVLLWAVPAG